MLKAPPDNSEGSEVDSSDSESALCDHCGQRDAGQCVKDCPKVSIDTKEHGADVFLGVK